MFTSFSTALSALNATSTAIDVVGNNLANLNTTGFKSSVVSFHDLVTQSLGAGLGETQVGFGTARPLTFRQFTQGAVQASSGMLDAAIQGDGFFVLRDDENNATLYTRSGDFQVDAVGNLLTSTGQRVQGWNNADASGPITDIVVPVGQLRAPVATSSFSMDMNLNPDDTSFSKTIQVIDSLGNPLVLTVNMTRDPATPLQWTAQVTAPAGSLLTGTPPAPTTTPTPLLMDNTATPPVEAPVILTFDSDGTLASVTDSAGNPLTSVPLTITGLADHAADWAATPMNWNLFNGGAPRITQFAQPSSVSANDQDGQPSAQLTKVGLADGGQVMAQYSNGTQMVVGQVALASIRNPESLIAVGSNNFETSAQSALPAIGVPNTGGRGQVVGGSLEASTVDIAREFTDLIVFQRAYEANSKIITASNELSQTTTNLIR